MGRPAPQPEGWDEDLHRRGLDALIAALGEEDAQKFLMMTGVSATSYFLEHALGGLIPDPLVYVLKITLRDSKPVIWRRMSLWSTCSLGELHSALQIAFGWLNSHLHRFENKHGQFAPFYDDVPDANIEGARDEDETLLAEVLQKKGDKLTYVYDMGDNWEHEIVLEKTLAVPNGEVHPPAPVCMGGENAGPPEDSGGVFGYEEGLQILSDPKDEQYEDYREWYGEDFDATHFDLKETNDELKDYWAHLQKLFREFLEEES